MFVKLCIVFALTYGNTKCFVSCFGDVVYKPNNQILNHGTNYIFDMTRKLRYSRPSKQERRDQIKLKLMNWFGFGSSSSNESTIVNNQQQDKSSNPSTWQLGNGKSSLPKGASGGVVTIMDSMDKLKRSQRIGKLTAALVQELKTITVEGSSENGKIKIQFDGQQNPISTSIDEYYFKEKMDVNEFNSAITHAMRDAQIKSIEKMNEKMKSVYNELGFYIQQ